VVEAYRKTSVRGFAECCAAVRDLDLRADLARILAPTLVIAGASDPGTTVEHAEALVAGIAGSDLYTLDASHLCSLEQAEEFTERLLEFFE
jgi:3-oxoadipate enol-lactonase